MSSPSFVSNADSQPGPMTFAVMPSGPLERDPGTAKVSVQKSSIWNMWYLSPAGGSVSMAGPTDRSTQAAEKSVSMFGRATERHLSVAVFIWWTKRLRGSSFLGVVTTRSCRFVTSMTTNG
jgi:hypothetical protein